MFRITITLIFIFISHLVNAETPQWAVGVSGVGRDTVSSVTANDSQSCMSGNSQGGLIGFKGITEKGEQEIKSTEVNMQREVVILTCVDNSGNLMSMSEFLADGVIKISDMEFSDNGSLYIAGFFAKKLKLPVDLNSKKTSFKDLKGENGVDGFVARYSKNGKLDWFKSLTNETGTQAIQLHALSRDKGVIVQGVFYKSLKINESITLTGSASKDHYLVNYNSNGAVNWVQHWSVDKGTIIAGGVSANDKYVYETFTHESDTAQSLGRKDVILVKRELTSGAIIWQKRLGGKSMDTTVKPVTDSNDKVYIAINFQGSVQLPQQDEEIKSQGPGDIVIAGYDGNGKLVDHYHFGSNGADMMVEMDLFQNQLIYSYFYISQENRKVMFKIQSINLTIGATKDLNIGHLLSKDFSVHSSIVKGNRLIYTGVIFKKKGSSYDYKQNKLFSAAKSDMYIASYLLEK